MKKFFTCCIILILCINILNCSVITAKDNTAPAILSSNPKNNDVVSPNSISIKITFSENVFKGSAFSKIILKNSNSIASPVICSLKGKTLNIVPKAKLEINKYILEIPVKAIKDSVGNYLKSKYVLIFTVKSNKLPLPTTTTTPAAMTTTPAAMTTAKTTSATMTTTPATMTTTPMSITTTTATTKVAFYCDFEPESPGITWNIMGDASNPLNVEVDTTVSKSGTHSIKIYGTAVSGNLKKAVSIDITKRYELSVNVWNEVISTQGSEDGAFIVVAQLDAQGNIIPDTQKGINWKYKLTGTKINVIGINPVTEAANIGIYIGLHGTGTFWVDDVTLTEFSD